MYNSAHPAYQPSCPHGEESYEYRRCLCWYKKERERMNEANDRLTSHRHESVADDGGWSSSVEQSTTGDTLCARHGPLCVDNHTPVRREPTDRIGFFGKLLGLRSSGLPDSGESQLPDPEVGDPVREVPERSQCWDIGASGYYTVPDTAPVERPDTYAFSDSYPYTRAELESESVSDTTPDTGSEWKSASDTERYTANDRHFGSGGEDSEC